MEMIGKVLGNRYEIKELIGTGGMATVYKAFDKLLNRNIAVKILKDEFANDAEFLKRFQVEAQAAASLTHTNIVSIYDVGDENNLHYIVMELVNGKTLKELIKERGRLEWKDAVKIASQIASGLEQAHKNHIIHRDIKPHNIILTRDGIAKITDFGIAKAVSNSTINAFGSTVGSVHYFSPEHARGGYTDEKSDIYSLGVVLYEMLTGKLPFDAETPVGVAVKHLQETPIEPSELVPEIPLGVNNIVVKAMQKDVNSRYSSASAMFSDLQKTLKYPSGEVTTTIKLDGRGEFPTQKVPIIGAQKESIEPERNVKKVRYSEDESMGSTKKGRTKKQAIIRVVVLLFVVALLFGGSFMLATKIAPVIFGDNNVKVPMLVGLHKDEAEKQLADLGLKMEVQGVTSNKEYPKDYVFYQQYTEGFKLKKGATVEVRISKGMDTVFAPDVTTMSPEAAKIEIEKYNLVYQEKEEASATVPAGSIIKQEPDVNSEVQIGSVITVFISTGTVDGMVQVPNVVGGTEAEAREAILTAKLVPVVEYVVVSTAKEGEVVSQEPVKDELVSEMTEVKIVVNKKEDEKPNDNTQPSGNNNGQNGNSNSQGGNNTTPTNKTITIDLSNKGSRDRFVVKVELQNSTVGSKIVYEGTHQRNDGKINVNLPNGVNSGMVKVYIDNALDSEMVIK